MKEKELRIALVCFGGVSLAIYMHGISKEVLKLVRASAALHGVTDRTARQAALYDEVALDRRDVQDTEPVYFELLKTIGRRIDLRVIVDIVAGASAGGINGTMLARAISHDLPMDRLRDLWLDNGDVSVLLTPDTRAGRVAKVALKPLIMGVAATGWLPAIRDAEVRRNVALFASSKWFSPPLDGPNMAALMYGAVTAMGRPQRRQASLVPSRQKLDLFVTLTSYHGLQYQVPIHFPPLVHEREHRQVLHFQYQRSQNGEADSDFEYANGPALAFAARATSSFPGAFPPSQIAEIDRVVAAAGDLWPHREMFFEKNFRRYLRAGIDPAAVCFIDGSVLNNKPFREAIAAIHGRPAYRQVDRRLVYIDPSPTTPSEDTFSVPGFFSTLKGAISDLPRAQPVSDELNWVIDFNDRVHQLRQIVEGARPSVNRLVSDIVEAHGDWSIAAEQITAWREQVNAQVPRDAGFSYQGYVRLKLASVLAFVGRQICLLRGTPERSPLARTIKATIETWAVRNAIAYTDADALAPPDEQAGLEGLAPWAKFLLAFDVDYRKRRLNFLIEGQNRLYQRREGADGRMPNPAAVDRLKRDFYACLDQLRRKQEPRAFSRETIDLAAEIFANEPSGADMQRLRAYAGRLIDSHGDKLNALMERMAKDIDLATSTRDVDLLLAGMDPAEWPDDAHREVLINYIGFPYWDVLTLPVTTTREAGEFREILVERISPLDAQTLPRFSGDACLKGTGFGYFAAFLSRAYRENDYLLGRLHAIDRLVDIVCDAAGTDAGLAEADIGAFKKRAFAAVINAEVSNLRESDELLSALSGDIARL